MSISSKLNVAETEGITGTLNFTGNPGGNFYFQKYHLDHRIHGH